MLNGYQSMEVIFLYYYKIVFVEIDLIFVVYVSAAAADECKLYCRVYKSNIYFLLKDKVWDDRFFFCTNVIINVCL